MSLTRERRAFSTMLGKRHGMHQGGETLIECFGSIADLKLNRSLLGVEQVLLELNKLRT